MAASRSSSLSYKLPSQRPSWTTHPASSVTSLPAHLPLLLAVFPCLFVVDLSPKNVNYLSVETVDLIHSCIPIVGTHSCSRSLITISRIDGWMDELGNDLKHILWKIAMKWDRKPKWKMERLTCNAIYQKHRTLKAEVKSPQGKFLSSWAQRFPAGGHLAHRCQAPTACQIMRVS